MVTHFIFFVVTVITVIKLQFQFGMRLWQYVFAQTMYSVYVSSSSNLVRLSLSTEFWQVRWFHPLYGKLTTTSYRILCYYLCNNGKEEIFNNVRFVFVVLHTRVVLKQTYKQVSNYYQLGSMVFIVTRILFIKRKLFLKKICCFEKVNVY